MASRPVTHSRKNRDGDITHVGNPSEFWSPRSVSDAISDIRLRVHDYYVPSRFGNVRIVVRQGTYGPYLATEPDTHLENNLDNLPDI